MIRREEFTGRTVSLINRTEPETDRKKTQGKRNWKQKPISINQSIYLQLYTSITQCLQSICSKETVPVIDRWVSP